MKPLSASTVSTWTPLFLRLECLFPRSVSYFSIHLPHPPTHTHPHPSPRPDHAPSGDQMAAINRRVTTPLLRCAAQNKFLGAGGLCVAGSESCPAITPPASMSVSIAPPGLAFERLPGATATFACPTGFVPTTARPAICLKNGTWGLGGIPDAGCRPCSNITAQCTRCNSGQCEACGGDLMLTAERTCSERRSCTDVTSTGTYTMANGATVYCLVADGKKWTKISSWSQGYDITTGARNAAACTLTTRRPVPPPNPVFFVAGRSFRLCPPLTA